MLITIIERNKAFNLNFFLYCGVKNRKKNYIYLSFDSLSFFFFYLIQVAFVLI